MSKKHKQSRSAKNVQIHKVLVLSQKTFSDARKNNPKSKNALLLAQRAFEKAVKNKILSAQDARDLLQDPKRFNSYLKQAEEIETKEVNEILNRILNNTDPKTALLIGVAASMIVGGLFLVAGPIVAELEQPLIDHLFHKNSAEITHPTLFKDQQADNLTDIYNNTTIYNNITINNNFGAGVAKVC